MFGAPLVSGMMHFPRNYTKAEVLLSEATILYWSNFARTGYEQVYPTHTLVAIHLPDLTTIMWFIFRVLFEIKGLTPTNPGSSGVKGIGSKQSLNNFNYML